MNKKQKCISLSLAKELQEVAKEAGFKLPESEYSWIIGKQKPPYLDDTDTAKITIEIDNDKKKKVKYVPSPDTSELGEILKNFDHPVPYWCSQANVKSWCSFKNGEAYEIEEDNEAEARGKMLIYLIKNKLLT